MQFWQSCPRTYYTGWFCCMLATYRLKYILNTTCRSNHSRLLLIQYRMQSTAILELFRIQAKTFRWYFFDLLYSSVLYYFKRFSVVNISDYFSAGMISRYKCWVPRFNSSCLFTNHSAVSWGNIHEREYAALLVFDLSIYGQYLKNYHNVFYTGLTGWYSAYSLFSSTLWLSTDYSRHYSVL